jgi:hypothetical protein
MSVTESDGLPASVLAFSSDGHSIRVRWVSAELSDVDGFEFVGPEIADE